MKQFNRPAQRGRTLLQKCSKSYSIEFEVEISHLVPFYIMVPLFPVSEGIENDNQENDPVDSTKDISQGNERILL